MSWYQATGVPLEQLSVRFQIFTKKQLKATVSTFLHHTHTKENWHFQM